MNPVVVRHIDVDLAEKLAIAVEDLDTPVAAVGHIDVACVIDGDAVRSIELPGTIPWLTPRLDPVSFLIDLGNPGIDVAVADVRIACRVPGHIGDLAELPVDRWKGRLRMFQRTSTLVGSFLPAPENH